MEVGDNLEGILEHGALAYTGMLVETPERIAKLREIFKVEDDRPESERGRGYLVGPSGGGVRITPSLFYLVTSADPTAKLAPDGSVAKCGIYSQWMLQQLTKLSHTTPLSLYTEDLYKIVELLKVYDRLKGRLPVEKRNIMAVKGPSELRELVKVLEPSTDPSADDAEADDVSIDILPDTGEWTVFVPKTKEAAIRYGKGTEWCTATTSEHHNRYADYAKMGPLFIAIKKDSPRERYQFHTESDQYMDREDQPVDSGFFDAHPEIGRAILNYKKQRGMKMPVRVREHLSRGSVLGDYAEASDKERSEILMYLRIDTVIKGWQTGIIKSSDLNAVKGSPRLHFEDDLKTVTLVANAPEDMALFFKYRARSDSKLWGTGDRQEGDPTSARRYFLTACKNEKWRSGTEPFKRCMKALDEVIGGVHVTTGTSVQYWEFTLEELNSIIEFIDNNRPIDGHYPSTAFTFYNFAPQWAQSLYPSSGLIDVVASVDDITESAADMTSWLLDSDDHGAKAIMETPERIAKLREIFKVGGTPTELDAPGRPVHPGMPEEVFQTALRADPTAKLAPDGSVAKCGIYSQWILKHYTHLTAPSKARFAEDAYKFTDYLRLFDKNKGKLPVNKRDIMSYESIHDLWTQVEPFHNEIKAAEQSKERLEKVGKNDTAYLLDGPAYRVLVPLTKESAIYWGSDTEWCTADERDDWNRFEVYNKEGPLYIAISKADPAVKYQFHLESRQFMDVDDDEIDYVDFFAKNPEVGAAIVKHRDAKECITDVRALEYLAPDAVFEKYAKSSVADRKYYLDNLSVRMILRGLAAKAWSAEKLNAVQKSIRFDAADSVRLRVGFVFAGLIDAEWFMAEGGRNHSPRADFKSMLNGGADFTDYGGGPSVSDCKDSINSDNTDMIQRICFDADVLDEDGDIQWAELPLEVDRAILKHWADGESQAQESAYYNAYVEALEEVLGTLKHESDGKVVFWNSLERFQEIVTDTLEDENDEYRHTTLDELEDHYQKLLDAGDSLADPGDLRNTYGDLDVDEFNKNLAADLEEMDPGPEAEAGLQELLDKRKDEEVAAARLYGKDDGWRGMKHLAMEIARDRGVPVAGVQERIKELVTDAESFKKYCSKYLWPDQVKTALSELYGVQQESTFVRAILR